MTWNNTSSAPGTDPPDVHRALACSVAQPRTKRPVACRLTQGQGVSQPPSQRDSSHHVTSAHCLPERLSDQKAGPSIGQARSLCHEKGGAEAPGGSLVFPQRWHFTQLIANAVTHPERSKMSLTSAAGAMGCGSSCLGDMEAAQEAEEKYQV